MIAVNAIEVLAAVISVYAGVIVALAFLLARTREKVVKLEEWQRMAEKRWNGKG